MSEEPQVEQSSFESLKDLIKSSIAAGEAAKEELRLEIKSSTEAGKENLERQEKMWATTNQCMEAIERNVAGCAERIKLVEGRVDTIDDGLKSLKKDVEQLRNRTTRASVNIVKDEAELALCRRSVLLWPIKFEAGQSLGNLKESVRDFHKEKMKLSDVELSLLGDFAVKRPLPSGGKYEEAPVQVEFPTSDDRDFVMSRSGALRSSTGEKEGSIRMKVPKFLIPLKQMLEAEAEKIRREKKLWVQIRLVDGSEMLAIFSKDPQNKAGRWIKHAPSSQERKYFA